MKFLILSAISSAVLLYGMVFIYGYTGTTSLTGIAEQIGRLMESGELEPGGGVRRQQGASLRNRPCDRRVWIQDIERAVPVLGAGRVRGRPDADHRVPISRVQGGWIRSDTAGCSTYRSRSEY